jgi:hypothetical protein
MCSNLDLVESQCREVYRWLQTLDPSPLHNRACEDYEPGTGEWTLRSPNWKDWLSGKHRCLWIHGIPGAGKTTLASFLIQNVKEHCRQMIGTTVGDCYYYCSFRHNQHEASSFLRWIIGQFSRQAEAVPTILYELYKSGVQPSIPNLLDILEATLDNFDAAYVVVDALDESNPRLDLLKIIRDLSTDARFSKIRLLATSREYLDIETIMIPISVDISMSNPLVEDDIRTCVRSLLASKLKFKRWPKDLLLEVEETVSKEAKGM